MDRSVILLSERYCRRSDETFPAVVTGYMVRYKIHDEFQPGLVHPVQQRPELTVSFVNIVSKIGIDIIVVDYGIWRTCITFDNLSEGSGHTFV